MKANPVDGSKMMCWFVFTVLGMCLFAAAEPAGGWSLPDAAQVAKELGYGPERVGAILAVVGITSTLGKAILIGPLTKRWGEAPIIKASLAASSAGFLVLLLATTYPGVLLATGVFILSKTLLRTVIISPAPSRHF